MITVTIDGVVQQAASSERLIDVINRAGVKISQVCYHPQLGPIQTRDTCMVENNGRLVRACATNASDGMEIFTRTEKGSLTLTIVFSSDSSARTFGTKKVPPNSVRQIMPVNILRYIVKSSFLEMEFSSRNRKAFSISNRMEDDCPGMEHLQ
jgi:hypothetical protein